MRSGKFVGCLVHFSKSESPISTKFFTNAQHKSKKLLIFERPRSKFRVKIALQKNLQTVIARTWFENIFTKFVSLIDTGLVVWEIILAWSLIFNEIQEGGLDSLNVVYIASPTVRPMALSEIQRPIPWWPQTMTATNYDHAGHSNENAKKTNYKCTFKLI